MNDTYPKWLCSTDWNRAEQHTKKPSPLDSLKY
uniref:Uncharacterized protein n=1 Tax=Anguilla anguilla TaxID=7936 RepID=A0A0E9RU28_ANGAN